MKRDRWIGSSGPFLDSLPGSFSMNHNSLTLMLAVAISACVSSKSNPETVRAECEADDGPSCYLIGSWHEAGAFDVIQNLSLAVELYERSCGLGEVVACYALGSIYQSGESELRDSERAAELYERACDGEEMAACYSLAQMLETGDGVARDADRAADLYRRTCEVVDVACFRVQDTAAMDEVVEGRAVTRSRYTLAPQILNRQEIIGAIEREYPDHLRRAGATATTTIHFFVGPTGGVEEIRIDQTSGSAEFDAAALRVAQVFEFRSALFRVSEVSAWTSRPITFQI